MGCVRGWLKLHTLFTYLFRNLYIKPRHFQSAMHRKGLIFKRIETHIDFWVQCLILIDATCTSPQWNQSSCELHTQIPQSNLRSDTLSPTHTQAPPLSLSALLSYFATHWNSSTPPPLCVFCFHRFTQVHLKELLIISGHTPTLLVESHSLFAIQFSTCTAQCEVYSLLQTVQPFVYGANSTVLICSYLC